MTPIALSNPSPILCNPPRPPTQPSWAEPCFFFFFCIDVKCTVCETVSGVWCGDSFIVATRLPWDALRSARPMSWPGSGFQSPRPGQSTSQECRNICPSLGTDLRTHASVLLGGFSTEPLPSRTPGFLLYCGAATAQALNCQPLELD